MNVSKEIVRCLGPLASDSLQTSENLRVAMARVLNQLVVVLGLVSKLLRQNTHTLRLIAAVKISERRSTQDATLNRALDDLANLVSEIQAAESISGLYRLKRLLTAR